jgi:hypothetical protein
MAEDNRVIVEVQDGAAGAAGGGDNKTNKLIKEQVKLAEEAKKTTKRNFIKEYAATAGINLTIASVLKQSQVFTSTLGSIFQILGALVDVILAPFLPYIVPWIRKLADTIPKIAAWAQATAEVVGPRIASFIANVVEYVKAAFEGDFSTATEKIKGFFDKLWNDIIEIALPWLEIRLEKIDEYLQKLWRDFLAPMLADVRDAIYDNFPQIEAAVIWLGKIFELIPAAWKEGTRFLSEYWSYYVVPLLRNVKVGINWLKDYLPPILKAGFELISAGLKEAQFVIANAGKISLLNFAKGAMRLVPGMSFVQGLVHDLTGKQPESATNIVKALKGFDSGYGDAKTALGQAITDMRDNTPRWFGFGGTDRNPSGNLSRAPQGFTLDLNFNLEGELERRQKQRYLVNLQEDYNEQTQKGAVNFGAHDVYGEDSMYGWM